MKKKLNIVLLVLVLSLWGTLIYKYLNQYFIKNEPLNHTTTTNYSVNNEILKKDTFELSKIRRDPFLGSYTGFVKSVNIINAQKKITKTQFKKESLKTPNNRFPIISYYGYIKAIDKSQETILLIIDGKFSKLKLNEDKAGLKVTALKKDSIKVCYNKEFRWFFKK